MHIETPGERSSELWPHWWTCGSARCAPRTTSSPRTICVGLRPEAESGIAGVERLTVAYDGGAPCGFAGSQDGKLEMLFVAPGGARAPVSGARCWRMPWSMRACARST